MDQLDKYWEELEERYEQWIASREIFECEEVHDAFTAGYQAGYFAGLDRGMDLEHDALQHIVEGD
jgi:hypothetical protein